MPIEAGDSILKLLWGVFRLEIKFSTLRFNLMDHFVWELTNLMCLIQPKFLRVFISVSFSVRHKFSDHNNILKP